MSSFPGFSCICDLLFRCFSFKVLRSFELRWDVFSIDVNLAGVKSFPLREMPDKLERRVESVGNDVVACGPLWLH